jgi:hypothetical protein
MVRVRFAPSPTGSLHLGNALVAVANQRFLCDHGGGRFMLRIDDTDRVVPDGESTIVADLAWLGVHYDEGPVRQSERFDVHRAAARRLVEAQKAYEEDGAIRFHFRGRPILVRSDGRPTYHLASVVDDLDLGVTHVIRGTDLLPSTPLHVALAEALGGRPPEYVHVGFMLGPDGRKLSKRHGASTLSDLREQGIPPEAVRRYLDELDMPRGDVHLDLPRIRRLAIEAINAIPAQELAQRLEVPVELVPALRGARDLNEAREFARIVLEPEGADASADARPTLERFRELREGANGTLDEQGARELVREVKAVGGDLRALRLALTSRDRGPELWAVVLALPRDEALNRIDAALAAS